jgi:hypothetical protein
MAIATARFNSTTGEESIRARAPTCHFAKLFGPEFCPLFGIIVREFYSAEDLGFLDRICGIIERLEDVHQRTLARSALVRTCMKKQPRGKFTVAAIPRLALHHLFS